MSLGEYNPDLEAVVDHKIQDMMDEHEKLLSKVAADKDGMHFIKPDFDRILNDPVQRRLQEDTRLDFLLRMKNSLNESFDNPGYVHPHGMTEYDYRAIPEKRKPGLEHFKMRARRENYIYLGVHTELDALMSLFIQKLMKTQPADPIRFAGEFFTLKGTTFEEFSKLIKEEEIKLKLYRNSNYRVGKSGYWPAGLPEVNEVKTLNLGAVAEGFTISPAISRQAEEIKSPVELPSSQEKLPEKQYCKDRFGRTYPQWDFSCVGEDFVGSEWGGEYDYTHFRESSLPFRGEHSASETSLTTGEIQHQFSIESDDDDYGKKPEFDLNRRHYSIFNAREPKHDQDEEPKSQSSKN